MKYFKRFASAFMATLMLTNLFACTSGSGNTDTTTTTAVTENDSKIKLTDEEITLYKSYSEENAKRALEIANATIGVYMDKETYKRINTVLLAENCMINPNQTTFTSSGVASVWHYTAFWTMQSRLLSITTGDNANYFSKLYSDTYESMEYYEGTASLTTYTDTSPFTMYAVQRSSGKGRADITGIAAVYDDQMWIIRELIYGYELTGSQLYLDEAERLTEVCLAGWDVTKDADGNEIGGICWGPGYFSKHTCSNAPLIQPLVELSEIYTAKGETEKADYYLNWAIKVYDFCVKYFTLGSVYGDWVGSWRATEGSGKNAHYVTTEQLTDVDKNTYTYNTGTMVSGAAALYRVTGESKYLSTAKRNATGALSHFTDKNILEGYRLWPNDATIWFNLIMLEGYLELYEFEPELCLEAINTFQTSLDYAYEHYAKSGFLPANYLTGWNRRNEKDVKKSVMDQTTAAQMYAVLSEFYASITE